MSQAIVVAADGRREVLGFDVGDSEHEGFWTGFLRSLKTRGLGGVKLVMSDAHTGLKKAIGTVFEGAGWQRCRVRFMRNVLAVVPKRFQEMVAPIIRTIFAQPDLLAPALVPRRHWRQIWSTNPLKWVNKEIKRPTVVVGVFPNAAALLRLAGFVLIEQHDESEVAERRYFSEASMLELAVMNDPVEAIDEAVTLPELTAA